MADMVAVTVRTTKRCLKSVCRCTSVPVRELLNSARSTYREMFILYELSTSKK